MKQDVQLYNIWGLDDEFSHFRLFSQKFENLHYGLFKRQ